MSLVKEPMNINDDEDLPENDLPVDDDDLPVDDDDDLPVDDDDLPEADDDDDLPEEDDDLPEDDNIEDNLGQDQTLGIGQDYMIENEDNYSDSDENICLISNTPLTDNSVKLCCGHQFNYNDIYKEIHYQKKQQHNYETQKLYTNQIKCPYCRTVQNGLLPWYEGKNKCAGVNWPPKYQYKPNKCTYEYLSGKRKVHQCSKACIGKYCPNHEKIIKIRLEKQKQK